MKKRLLFLFCSTLAFLLFLILNPLAFGNEAGETNDVNTLLPEYNALDSLPGATLDSSVLYINSPGEGIILRDSLGICWQLSVDTSGALHTVEVVCPEEL